jgi:hypothetical protein
MLVVVVVVVVVVHFAVVHCALFCSCVALRIWFVATAHAIPW